jgi:hypothetical protein
MHRSFKLLVVSTIRAYMPILSITLETSYSSSTRISKIGQHHRAIDIPVPYIGIV